MKYLLAIAGIAAGLCAGFVFSISETSIDLGVVAILASMSLTGIGLATITHAIDAHREKMEDIANDTAEEARRQHRELVASILGSAAKVD